MTDILGIREYVKIELCKGFKNICITGNIKNKYKEELKFNLHSINNEQNIRNTSIPPLNNNKYSRGLSLALVIINIMMWTVTVIK